MSEDSEDNRVQIALAMVEAPWTKEQVAHANEFQQSGTMHPFTCTTDSTMLVATTEGWICPTCDYTQNWAYRGMLDGAIIIQMRDSLGLDSQMFRDISDVPSVDRDSVDLVSVVIAIGNSDNNLVQADWALYCDRVDTWVTNCEEGNFIHVHGRWHSLPNAPFQNAAWAFSIHPSRTHQARWELGSIAAAFDQESIAWTQGETTFVPGTTQER